MTAETIAKALGGHRRGATWMVCCPAHDDRCPSLSISVGKGGKVLVCCHAGCDQHDVIAALTNRGLWDTTRKSDGCFADKRPNVSAAKPDPDAGERTEAAFRIWHSSKRIDGSLGEAYLRSRGIVLPTPPRLRFHPSLKHSSGGHWPAMVALVTHGETGSPIAIHRTFLARDGQGKAPVVPAKMMLGPCRGGVVRLSEAGELLMVGEGIETCLSAMQATNHPTWAALSTSGLRSLNLPPNIRKVIVLADGDAPGEVAAQHCAQRWLKEGLQANDDGRPYLIRGAELIRFLRARQQRLAEAERIEKLRAVKNDMELIIAKNRTGPCNTVQLFTDIGCAVVRDLDHHHG